MIIMLSSGIALALYSGMNTLTYTTKGARLIQRVSQECREREVAAASAALKAFPKGPTGLTPDAVKGSTEYQAAKRRYQVAFDALRVGNTNRKDLR